MVIEPETTASDSTETPKRMKPLDEFQIKMFKAISGMDIHDAWDKIPHERFLSMERGAIAAAQVAKDLARRAFEAGAVDQRRAVCFGLGLSSHIWIYPRDVDKIQDWLIRTPICEPTEFLTSEGITE